MRLGSDVALRLLDGSWLSAGNEDEDKHILVAHRKKNK